MRLKGQPEVASDAQAAETVRIKLLWMGAANEAARWLGFEPPDESAQELGCHIDWRKAAACPSSRSKSAMLWESRHVTKNEILTPI